VHRSNKVIGTGVVIHDKIWMQINAEAIEKELSL